MNREALGPCVVVLVMLVGVVATAQAQTQPSGQAPSPVLPEDRPPGAEGETEAASGEARRLGDSWEAYEAEAYDQALQGFVDEQVERPEDPDLTFNIGSVHYKMKNYEEAEKSFATVAMAGDPELRGQALYNLGNCAYRQGKLQEAVDLYKAALEVDPDDADAKFNLEYVRDEIRRRHEEQQKRQQEQQQQQQQDQQQGQQQQQQQGGQDSDRDGLSDDTERSAQNPTDPHDADSDDDGLLDGQEDRNANGRVDDGETDPNNPDSDGDGKSDGQEALEQQDPEQQQGEQEPQGEPEELEGLSREEAERYLQALEEGRPEQREPHRGRRRRPAKDW